MIVTQPYSAHNTASHTGDRNIMEIKEVLQLYDYLNDMKKKIDIYEQLKENEERFEKLKYYLDEILNKIE